MGNNFKEKRISFYICILNGIAFLLCDFSYDGLRVMCALHICACVHYDNLPGNPYVHTSTIHQLATYLVGSSQHIVLCRFVGFLSV